MRLRNLFEAEVADLSQIFRKSERYLVHGTNSIRGFGSRIHNSDMLYESELEPATVRVED